MCDFVQRHTPDKKRPIAGQRSGGQHDSQSSVRFFQITNVQCVPGYRAGCPFPMSRPLPRQSGSLSSLAEISISPLSPPSADATPRDTSQTNSSHPSGIQTDTGLSSTSLSTLSPESHTRSLLPQSSPQ